MFEILAKFWKMKNATQISTKWFMNAAYVANKPDMTCESIWEKIFLIKMTQTPKACLLNPIERFVDGLIIMSV